MTVLDLPAFATSMFREEGEVNFMEEGSLTERLTAIDDDMGIGDKGGEKGEQKGEPDAVASRYAR